MKKSKVVFKILARVLLVVLLIIIVVGVPLIKFALENDIMQKRFFGEKAEYQGVIELWHVETFEGGAYSRSAWLEKRAIEFEMQNKGLYILTKTMTLGEMENRLQSGACPDLFSFSKGAEKIIESKLAVLNSAEFASVETNLLASGKNKGNLLAVPFCYSAYVLISNTEKLTRAGIEVQPHTLSDNIFNAGLVKHLKKKDKNIYSCVFGGGGDTSPNKIVAGFGGEKNELSLNPGCENFSGYDAYCDFVAGNSNILVGTLRDVSRVEGKVQAGAFADAIIEPISNFTDMVCYLGFSKANGELRARYAQKFISFCLSEKMQEKVAGMGLLSPTNNKLYEDGILCPIENMFLEGINCPNLFE